MVSCSFCINMPECGSQNIICIEMEIRMEEIFLYRLEKTQFYVISPL